MCKKTDKDMKDIFIEFLKENKVYDLFVKYGKESGKEGTLMDFLNKAPHETWYFDSYFFFTDTKEGNDFWQKLNDKWIAITKEYNKKKEEKVEEQKSEEKPEPKKDSNLKEKFEDFLKGAGVYRRFFLYLAEDRDKECVEKYFDEVESDRWVSCAFPWIDTDEGDGFWQSVSKDWQVILDKEQKNQKKYKLVITMKSADKNALIRDKDFIKTWNTSDIDLHFSKITEDE